LKGLGAEGGGFWVCFGAVLCRFGPFWSVLEPFGALLEVFWLCFDTVLVCFGAVLCRFGAFWLFLEPFGVVGVSFGALGSVFVKNVLERIFIKF
jgi:hypothetical protein